MSVDGIDTGAAGQIAGVTNKMPANRPEIKGEFGKLLDQELKNQEVAETTSGSSVQPGFATFPVYELAALDGLPDSADLREKGIKDTEQLIDILDQYRQGLDRERLDPQMMKETVQVLDQVSRDMLEYVNQVEHGELADLMQESLVMARVEVEKYSRGDYS
ncbi:MAG: hypothetical protein J7L25_06535 [Deltaproteobacteria bacterium]|nr:hypothetical protein [Candidatus Tharpella aukensis]